MKVILIIFCLLLVGMGIPEGEVQLKYQFKQGEQFTWVQFKKQSVKQTIMGMDHEMHNNMHGEYLLKVVEVSAGNARVGHSLHRSRKGPLMSSTAGLPAA